ncbi:sensor histidine kinase [Rhodopseudomonas palustris]|uniref:histidine kinase n=1 Tax=Rhodopseudomonas palustris TaxID=1076 RepID=A0A418VF90_RHOPL|nr:sensor histidine kinase [Rhodopseudomonas palustris]RJF74758.1 sensor histidine kinase [Rhodopseudomonas palustris]
MATQQSQSDRSQAAPPLAALRRHRDPQAGAEAMRRIGWCEDLLAAARNAASSSAITRPTGDCSASIVQPLMSGRQLPDLRAALAARPAAETAGSPGDIERIAAAQLALIDTLLSGTDQTAAMLTDPGASAATHFWLHYYAGMAAFLFDQDGDAADHLETARRLDRDGKFAELAASDLDRANFCYFLVLAYSRSTARGSLPPRGAAHIRSARDRFEASAKLDPVNFRSKHLLLEAEAARLLGDTLRAQSLYERAAGAAAQAGMPHESALAHELAGDAYLEAGLPTPALGCFQAAVLSYRAWGAAGKAAMLERRVSSQIAGAADAATISSEAPPASNAGNFAAAIVHEINQPLAGIITHADASLRWLERDQPDVAEARAGLLNIREAARRAAAIIRSLRALVKHKRATLLPVALDEVVQDTLRLVADDLCSHRIQVVTHLCTNATVRADRVQLQQVVLNLITNAIHAMAGTDVARRQLVIQSALAGDGWVRLCVEDRGCGIPDAVQARIFEPFFTTKQAGMGVGLAICRSIAEAHGGSIEVWSTLGKGTTFEMRLPLAYPAD